MDDVVDGCRLRVTSTGRGPAVLLIHGTAAALWGLVVDRLAVDHQVIEYDRRSFGGSVAEPLANTRRHTHDAAAVLERRACGPAIVIGWSVGGVIALDLAVSRPDLVAGVVVIEAPLFAKRRPRPDQVLSIIRTKLAARRDPRAGAVHFLNWALQRRGESISDLDRLPESWREAILGNASAILREIDAGTGKAELSLSALRGLTCPVRWLHGDRSAASFRAAARNDAADPKPHRGSGPRGWACTAVRPTGYSGQRGGRPRAVHTLKDPPSALFKPGPALRASWARPSARSAIRLRSGIGEPTATG